MKSQLSASCTSCAIALTNTEVQEKLLRICWANMNLNVLSNSSAASNEHTRTVDACTKIITSWVYGLKLAIHKPSY